MGMVGSHEPALAPEGTLVAGAHWRAMLVAPDAVAAVLTGVHACTNAAEADADADDADADADADA